MGLSELTALELGRQIKEGRVTAVEAAREALERIKMCIRDRPYACRQ